MNFSKLQYITSSPVLAEEACAAGVQWVQARIKNKSADETKIIAQEILAVCRKYNCICIINDHLETALEIGADGAHLGKEDLKIEEAKRIIGGKKFILGGTANTFEDVETLSQFKVDYIGLGPFRFTSTKEKLSPILGNDGYRKIISQLKKENIFAPPIFAIGGIVVSDVQEIVLTGIYGVAVSGVVSNSNNKKELIDQFNMNLNIRLKSQSVNFPGGL